MNRRLRLNLLVLLLVAAPAIAEATPAPDALPDDVREFLRAHCLKCHRGGDPKADLDLSRFDTVASVAGAPRIWEKVLGRVRAGEMPPADEEPPAAESRARFVEWIDTSLRSAACEDGVAPGPAITRRLNRDEYGATIRDLLGVHFNAAEVLPADGAGGEGFDNASEALFVSPVHLEKYMEAAEQALDYAIKDPRARKELLPVVPDDDTLPEDAARRVLERFVPLAFRRPARDGEVDGYLSLFRDATGRGEPFEEAITFALRGVLISPHFVFRIEEPVADASPRPLDGFELAGRLSYFLWGTMPDEKLFRVAREGKLVEADTLERQVVRMLDDRSSIGFATSFVEQWLGTRELGRGVKPDRSLSRRYDDDFEAVVKYEPVLFFQEILAKDLSLLTLLDADFSYMNNELARHYRLRIDGLREHPKRVDLPEDSHRGGVLAMAAVLAVSSHAHRTSPVLRGKWVLETLLGAPPPPPPPDVPALEEPGENAADAATVRERLLRHRADPTCATCHDRIDPIGFGLESYDVLGRWRTEDAGRRIDSRGRLPDGSSFDGPEELKALLLARKKEFVRHLTIQVLGYALCRGLTLEDYCVVDAICEELEKSDWSSHTLIKEIVQSVSFRYKAGPDPAAGGGRTSTPEDAR